MQFGNLSILFASIIMLMGPAAYVGAFPCPEGLSPFYVINFAPHAKPDGRLIRAIKPNDQELVDSKACCKVDQTCLPDPYEPGHYSLTIPQYKKACPLGK
ncbi:uncharacterized protein PGTG_00719 [Puccinia graminis f. sp. tritici CRL 75-36-700-3]|uniref:Long chronological lifespan protein 2 n=1 Tax=Puccinia graminis f. sp. tritici (strain CRL 75-36-700-3 / race SCCL) TaxID=418459 RepID=E3JRK1_PUCGT|nr:uncharacterized protein PGTG_00719 [Puccinia graminis f. sp. tritici CRL 75-36-700-3]EFP74763.1 hypothetical protein PGTG_00719 [Puccinia graminis f. sp. tritici CRL 75-36-700-3]